MVAGISPSMLPPTIAPIPESKAIMIRPKWFARCFFIMIVNAM